MFSLLKLLGICSLAGGKSLVDLYSINKRANSDEAILLKEQYDYKFKPLPQMKGYNRVLEFDVAHKRIRDCFQSIQKGDISNIVRSGKTYKEAVMELQLEWLKNNEPMFYNSGYTFEQYILEYARKTAYDNGYMPSCQQIGMRRNLMYDTLYSGKMPNHSYQLNIIFGIPDQKERERLIEVDKLYKYG